MNKQIRIREYYGYYHVEVKRSFLWIFPYWDTIFAHYSLSLCEHFHNELKEGKHKELL